MTRLSINLTDGTLEVEGEETFVKSVYEEFKEQLATAKLNVRPYNNGTPVQLIDQGSKVGGAKTTKPAKKSSVKRARGSFSIVKDLDLSAKTNSKSLRDFYAEKSPANAMECNAVFVYFLQQIAGIDSITIDHIYSCYKDVGIKYPNALRQSIADTSSRRGWLDTKSFDDIKIATPGENYVEHDLPKAKAQ